MPENNDVLDFDESEYNIKDEGAGGLQRDEDVDNVDLKNYKGIYANEENNQKYQCPQTGAHFEFNDICRRLNKVMERRKAYEE
jgi:hypothetical protein